LRIVFGLTRFVTAPNQTRSVDGKEDENEIASASDIRGHSDCSLKKYRYVGEQKTKRASGCGVVFTEFIFR
jgi:hypothetical protein